MRNAAALVSARASALRLSATTDAAHSPDHRAFCELWAIDRFRARMVSPRRGLAHGSHALAGPASTSRRELPPSGARNLACALELRVTPDSAVDSHLIGKLTLRQNSHAQSQHKHRRNNEIRVFEQQSSLSEPAQAAESSARTPASYIRLWAKQSKSFYV